MNKEESLDLSQVSVANLLNADAPANIPQPEVKEEQSEEAPTQEAATEETEVVEENDTSNEVETSASEEPTGDTEELAEAEDDEPGVIDTLRQKLGYEVEGTFKDDYEGVASFTQTVANEIAKEQLDTIFSQYPDVEKYLQFRYNGGDSQKYFQTHSPNVDYNAVQLSDDDVSTQRLIVQEHLAMQDYTPEEITEAVQDYMEAGLLYKHAQRGLTKLQQSQKSRAEQLIVSQKEQAEQHRNQVQQQWTSIQTTIDNGKLKGFEVPTADRKKFYSWMSDAVDKNGRTQRLIDRESMDLETQLAMEYLAWKNFDLNKLVTNSSRTKEAKNLKERLKQPTTASKRMKGGGSSYKAPKQLPSLKDLLQ